MLALFGKAEFRPMQRELIERALEGESSLGVLPTGSGKSLCYQIPAVMLGKLTIVVSPLIALMRDQVEGLEKLGIHCARYDSSLPDDEKQQVLKKAATGEICMLFVAPESLSSAAVETVVAGAELGLFVIDEAHCVSEWGHSFRPDYLGLPDYAARHRFHAVMALTATATERVRDDLCSVFGIAPGDVFCLPPTRENIGRTIRCLPLGEKLEALQQFLKEPGNSPAIVYANTRKDTEEVAAGLSSCGIVCKSYHAGMPADVRAKVQDDFLYGEVPVLVATIAFGMGIDKPDVRSVVHFHLPSGPESYVQESGRAGRDGLPSKSLVLYHPADYKSSLNRIKANEPDEFALEKLLKSLLVRGQNVISFYGITTVCDVSEQVFNRILFDLERDGLIKTLGKGYQYYKVKPLYPISVITGGRDEDEANLLSWLDENRDGEIMDIALSGNLSWQEAVAWLEELVASGEWQVAFRQRALLIESRRDGQGTTHEALGKYTAYFNRQMQHEQQRLATCLQFFLQDSCLTNSLDEYFGFHREEPCGYCGFCTGENQMDDTLEDIVEPISDDMFGQISELVRENKPALSRPVQLTRFLLGIIGPAAMRARLWNHPLYGALADHPWDDIHAISTALLGR